MIKKGDWIGMIRFGSQVDLFLPIQFDILVSIGQQVYAKKSIVAEAH
jgi:phosphatidylserine decarboxylase